VSAVHATGEAPAGLRPKPVTDWLQRLGIADAAPLRFERFGHGKSNLTFVVTDSAGNRCVLRRPPLGELLPSAHDVARERRVLMALEATAVPTPRVLAFTEPGDISDAPLLVMDYVDGLVVQDLDTGATLPPELRRSVGLGAVAALAAVHAVDLEQSRLSSLASQSSYAARQLKRWQGQWERSRTREIPELDRLAARLAAAIPEQHEVTLVHGDFHLRNLIVSPQDGTVRAVLDWELCTLGDPLADLGGLLSYWPHAGEPATAINAASTLPGFLSRDQLASTYAERTGRALDALGFWHVLALWKVAVIAEGVLRRSREQPDNASPSGSVTAQGVDELVARAIAAAADVGL
jgi:aminoglycoside phosphotransferase (APT) family kinase protein